MEAGGEAGGRGQVHSVWRPAKSQPPRPLTGGPPWPSGSRDPRVVTVGGLPALTPPAPHLCRAPRLLGLCPQAPSPGASVSRGPGTPRHRHAQPPADACQRGPLGLTRMAGSAAAAARGLHVGDRDWQLGSMSLVAEQLAWVCSHGDSEARQSQPHAPATSSLCPDPAQPRGARWGRSLHPRVQHATRQGWREDEDSGPPW